MEMRTLMLLAFATTVAAFSIPVLVPTNYKRGDTLPILVGSLESDNAELPFAFYTLNWCENTQGKGYDLKPAAKSFKGVDLVHSPFDVSSDSKLMACSTRSGSRREGCPAGKN